MRLAPLNPLILAPALIALSLGAVKGGTAEATVYTSLSPVEMLRILEGEKGSVELDETEGDTTIEGRVNGTDYQVYFYECDGGALADPARPDSACLGFEYRAYFSGFTDDAETINAWNADNHYGTLWRDQDGDLALQLNTVVEGGITEANIRISFQWWLAVIESFETFIADRPAQ